MSIKEVPGKLKPVEDVNEFSSDEEELNPETAKYDLAYETRKRYTKICESLSIPKISMFIENLTNTNLVLAHRGVGSKAMHGITLSLRHNTWITDIDLTDNNLDKSGARSIASMLEDNNFIKKVNLSSNHIGCEGVSCLLKALQYKSNVVRLNLSNNKLSDKIADSLCEFLCENDSLLELDLSKNELSTNCGRKLGEGIEKNKTLQVLEVSWNQLRGDSTVEMAKGIAHNTALVYVNFAWNGFSNHGAEALGKSLHVNRALKRIDLSYNRIESKGLKSFGEALRVNKTLEVIRLGWNPIKSDGVTKIVKSCLENPSHTIREIYLESVFIDSDNLIYIDKLMSKIPDLILVHGGYTRDKRFNDDIDELRKQLLNILRTYLIDHRLRMVDLFNQWDKDNSRNISRDEFRKGVKECRIPFSESQLNILIEWLDSDESDSIEYSEFVGITDIE